jgi:heat shock protein HslJ
LIDRINKDSIYLEIKAGVVLIYLDGYKLPDDLAVGDKVYVEYEVDKIAEQNILQYLEVLEKAEVLEPPAISLEVYEGPVYVEKDNICYYRIEATVTGNPAPEISWSRDDSGGNLGTDKAQIDLKDVDEEYTLEATAKNSEGTAKDKVEITWGCEKPPENRPPDIEEIVITDDFYTETKYPVYVIATDPDGDELSYKWSVSAGTVEKSTSNPMFWTTPSSAGTYEVKVVVDDGNNGVATKAKNVEVKQEETPPEPPEEEITDNIWQWEKFISNDGSETVVSDPNEYMLLLGSDGNMYLLADCNSGSGTYELQNSSLTLNIEVVTRAICGPDSLSDQYISYLEDVSSYVLEDGKLYLDLRADAGNMVFRNVEITPF